MICGDVMKVIKCDNSVIDRLPNIFNLLYSLFGTVEVDLFSAIDDGNNMSFIAKNGINGVYIDNNGYKAFKVDFDNNLKAYMGDNFSAYYTEDGDVSFVDREDNEYNVSIYPLDEEEEGYNGEVIFKQYHPKEDVFCQLTYQHNYYEMSGKPKIYTYHTKHPNSVYIEKENNKNHDRSFGLIDRHIKSFNRFSFERGMIGYNLILVNEHGLFNTLLNNSYYLERDDTLKRFTKSSIVINGQYRDLWPLCTFYKPEEIESIVKKYGFKLEVPNEILNIYDGFDRSLNNIIVLLDQIRQKEVMDECGIKLQLVPEVK